MRVFYSGFALVLDLIFFTLILVFSLTSTLVYCCVLFIPWSVFTRVGRSDTHTCQVMNNLLDLYQQIFAAAWIVRVHRFIFRGFWLTPCIKCKQIAKNQNLKNFYQVEIKFLGTLSNAHNRPKLNCSSANEAISFWQS